MIMALFISQVVVMAVDFPLENAMPVQIKDAWAVEVGPGSVAAGDTTIRLDKAVCLTVPSANKVRVSDEVYPGLRVFNSGTAGWCKGDRLNAVIAEECSVTGSLFPGTLRLKSGPEEAKPFEKGKDFDVDEFWATFGRVEGGAIQEGQTVYADYDYSPCRLHSVVITPQGEVKLLLGEPGMVPVQPPTPGPGEVAVVNLWIPGGTEKLTEENLFPIQFKEKASQSSAGASAAETLLPKTLAKLRAGQPVKIVAWGDSVTCGGGVGANTPAWYQNQFAALLRERFPKASIQMLTAGWGGASSRQYMESPRGSEHDFIRDVLEPKPDLVTIEFVNDAYLDEAGVLSHYGKILEQLRGVGAEVVLIAPHLVRPDWMGVQTLKFDDDPRVYVKSLRRFAQENNLAVADGSGKWCHLWREGIPYMTLLSNYINHPDARGHRLFADALMELFP